MNHEQHLGKTVRVFYNGDDRPAATGKLIAIVPEPVLIVEDEKGQRHYFANSLRVEVARARTEPEWVPA